MREYSRQLRKEENMSPVSPVSHTELSVSIGLKNELRVGTSIPQY